MDSDLCPQKTAEKKRKREKKDKVEEQEQPKRVFFELDLIGGKREWHFSRPFWIMNMTVAILKFNGRDCRYLNPAMLTLDPSKNPRLKKTTPPTFKIIIDADAPTIQKYYEDHIKELQELINKYMKENNHEEVFIRIAPLNSKYL